MSTPAYDGKGQPPVAHGWFSGLAAWWNSLTPQYVTHTSSGISATARSGAGSPMTIDAPKAPAGASGTLGDSSSSPPATNGTDPESAPCAATP